MTDPKQYIHPIFLVDFDAINVGKYTYNRPVDPSWNITSMPLSQLTVF